MLLLVGLVIAGYGVLVLFNIFGIADSIAGTLDQANEFFRTSSRPNQQWSWMERNGLNPPRKFTRFMNKVNARSSGLLFIVIGGAAVYGGLR